MPNPDLPPLPDDIAENLNTHLGGFSQLMGLRFTHASYSEIRAEVLVGEHLLQPFGLVHGGVYAAIIETLASTGAALIAQTSQKGVVGLENTTSFLRATRSGTLYCCAHPLVTGRRTQVWTVDIKNQEEKAVASGRVRLMVVDKQEPLGK